MTSSFVIGFFALKYYLKFISKRMLFRQPIRNDGPASHIKTKQHTPTMGGFFIFFSTLVSSLLFLDLTNHHLLITLFVFTSFAMIGLTDDLMKVVYKNSRGFRGSIKLVIQFIIICIALLWLGHVDPIHINSRIFIPEIFFPLTQRYSIELGLAFYFLFIAFVIVGSSNAVNLTDGLDGLVSVPAMINLFSLSCLVFCAANADFAKYFSVPHISNSMELIFFAMSLIGSIAAFLSFNLKPAKIFMGDVGSLAIGSVLGVIAVIIKQELVFFIISLLFVIEASSVILQVGSYKLRKKRIFLMAPIHHHFEKLGWSEKKVVRLFWASSLLFAAIGMSIIFSGIS